MTKPLAVELYGTNAPFQMPCGCCMTVDASGDYHHWVRPGCDLDDTQHVRIRGYHYERWQDRPESVKAVCQ